MNHVRRVEPASHADFEHDRPDAAAGEVQKTHRGRDLEKCRTPFDMPRILLFELIDGLATSSTSSTSSAAEAGLPSIMNRSSRRCRWGEQYKPVRTPEAVSAAASIAAVDPFPLVPATWMTRRPTMRIVQPSEEAAHPAEPKLAGGPGHPHATRSSAGYRGSRVALGSRVAWRIGRVSTPGGSKPLNQ